MANEDQRMNRAQIRALAAQCRDDVIAGAPDLALARLRPVVTSRTPFPLLDLAGRIIAEARDERPVDFRGLLDALAATNAIGVWPLIGSALAAAYVPDNVSLSFAEARRYVLMADVWHATDAISERVLGEGLRTDFDEALTLLEGWRAEPSVWLRRAVGVATHLYAKREREEAARAAQLLDLLAPVLEERETAAVKGIGWGLKTIGRYHPDLLAEWLRRQLAHRSPRGTMVRKAVTYLPDAYKAEFA